MWHRAVAPVVVVVLLAVACRAPSTGAAPAVDAGVAPAPWDQGAVEWDILWDPHRTAVVVRWRVATGFALVGCTPGGDGTEPFSIELRGQQPEVAHVELPACHAAPADIRGTARVLPPTGESFVQFTAVPPGLREVSGLVRHQVCAARGCAPPRALPFRVGV